MKKKDIWKDVSDEELLIELGRRLKNAKVMSKTAKTAISLLKRKKKVPGIWNKLIIDFDDLSMRTKNALRRTSASTPGLMIFREVCSKSRLELGKIKYIGPRMLDEIEKWVEKTGYELKKAD